jgi:hypothetical protein
MSTRNRIEIQAMLLAGNFQFVKTNDPIRLTQARQGMEQVLAPARGQ